MTESVSRIRIGIAFLLALMLVGCMNSTHNVNYVINRGEPLPSGKVCRIMLGEAHFHPGNGANTNKAVAKAEAIRGWSRFTIFEYGRSYGEWSAANKRSMRCEHDKDASVWRCRADAQPCIG